MYEHTSSEEFNKTSVTVDLQEQGWYIGISLGLFQVNSWPSRPLLDACLTQLDSHY